MNQPQSLRTIPVAPVRKQLRVNVGAARAFEAFTRDFGIWWPRSHHIGKSPMVGGVIEPHAGGRWYERCEDGSECTWGKVLAWEPPERLVLAWQPNEQFQYDPALITSVEVRFIAEGASATRIEFEHRELERMGKNAQALRDAVDAPTGWGAILETYRTFATGG